MLLEIKNYNLHIKELNKEILNNLNFNMDKGEIIVLVGENGSGKTSFAMSMLGLDSYTRSGEVLIDDINLVGLNIETIAKSGLFVSFQSPPEIEGVSLLNFIITAYKTLYPDDSMSSFKLKKRIIELSNIVGLNSAFLDRNVNQGFSGGEKRKAEVLQMLALKPKLALLDEVDSGLDIKSSKSIAAIIKQSAIEDGRSYLIISHNVDFIRMVQPNRIVELKDKTFKSITLDELKDIDLIKK